MFQSMVSNVFSGMDAGALVLQAVIFIIAAGGAVLAVTLAGRRKTVRRRIHKDYDEPQAVAGGDVQKEQRAAAARRLVDRASSYFDTNDGKAAKKLQEQLVQAAFFHPKAVAYYFMARVAMAGLATIGALVAMPIFFPQAETAYFWAAIAGAALAGYLAPQFYLGQRRKSRNNEYRNGFPDFLDLMVVCADAGLSMEAAMERITTELADGYPALSTNLSITTLEIRAGRPLAEALESMGHRLGLPEARSFAVLLQQSQELGSSLTEALRVYSDDMRHQRLSRAEEKAYKLPAQLSVPLTVCIFPVVMIVALLPAIVRLMATGF